MAMTCYMHEHVRAARSGYGHPERPQRYAAVRRAVAAVGAPIVEAEPASREALERVHTPTYLDLVERFCAEGGGALDADTVVGEVSWPAALRAAGGAIAAAEQVAGGAVAGVQLAAGRPATTRSPPGRWASASSTAPPSPPRMPATRSAWSGWRCSTGTPTTATAHRRSSTSDPGVLYVSLHQYPFYPGSGAASERGAGAGEAQR